MRALHLRVININVSRAHYHVKIFAYSVDFYLNKRAPAEYTMIYRKVFMYISLAPFE
jgi:hypothetical protein